MHDSNRYVLYVNILWSPVLNHFLDYLRTKPLRQFFGYRTRMATAGRGISARRGFLRHDCKAGQLSQEILHAMKLLGIYIAITVDVEIFASGNFYVLNFRAFNLRHLAMWRKFFNVVCIYIYN